MADSPISLLPVASPLLGPELIPVVQSGITKQSTIGIAFGTSFLQAGTGAVARTASAKMRDIINAADFGAIGDGVTNNTTFLQNALNATPTGGTLYISQGTFLFTSLTIPSGIFIQGAGKYGTVLRTTSATLDAVLITSTTTVDFRDLAFGATVTRTGGYYIKLISSSYNSDSAFYRVLFQAAYNCLYFGTAAGWVITDCEFSGTVNNNIVVANTITPDAGDSAITNCIFSSANTTAVHILQPSSGGLKVIGNKFLGGNYHYLGQFNTGASGTSILIWEGNSSESAAAANMAFTSSASTNFSVIQITGNQFSVLTGAIGIQIVDPGYTFIDTVIINSNSFGLGASSTAINLARGGRISLGLNLYAGNGATVTGLNLGANIVSITIAPQDFRNITTAYAGTFTNATFNPPGFESGTITGVLTSTAYASLFSSAAGTITYAKPYAKAPVVQAIPLSTGGGVSVLLGNPGLTTCTYNVIGVTSGGSTSFTWTAQG